MPTIHPIADPVFSDDGNERLLYHGREFLASDGRELEALRTLVRDLFLAASLQIAGFGDLAIRYHHGDWRSFAERLEALGIIGTESAPIDDALAVRVDGLKAMDLLARHLQDERLVEHWLMFGVPDGADDDDFTAIADDPASFASCASAFLKIMRSSSAAANGFYFE